MNEKRKYKMGLLETLGIKDVLCSDWNLFFVFLLYNYKTKAK